VDADDESNNILHFEQGNLNAKVARLKNRQTERYFTCEISAFADADAMETEAGAINGSEKVTFSINGMEKERG